MKLIARLVLAVVSWILEHIADGHIEAHIAHGHLDVLDDPQHVATLIGVVAGVFLARATRGGGLLLAVASWAVEHMLHGHLGVLDDPWHIASLILVVVSVARRKPGVGEQRKLD